MAALLFPPLKVFSDCVGDHINVTADPASPAGKTDGGIIDQVNVLSVVLVISAVGIPVRMKIRHFLPLFVVEAAINRNCKMSAEFPYWTLISPSAICSQHLYFHPLLLYNFGNCQRWSVYRTSLVMIADLNSDFWDEQFQKQRYQGHWPALAADNNTTHFMRFIYQ